MASPTQDVGVCHQEWQPGGQGNMQAWKGKLSDEEILSVIAWFQSKWPKDIYNTWAKREMEKRGRTG